MGSLRNPVMEKEKEKEKEKEEELALFFEMRRREKEQDDLLLLQNSDEFDAPLGTTTGSSPIFSIVSTESGLKMDTDDFLNSDNDKNDYEWLLSPPSTPLFPSLELESEETVSSQLRTPEPCSPVQKCRPSNPHPEPAISNSSPREPKSSPRSNFSRPSSQRPLSSSGSKPSTPNGKATLSTSRSTLSSLSKTPLRTTSLKGMSAGASLKGMSSPSRSTQPTVPPRSPTSNLRSTIRSSTLITTKSSIPAPKSAPTLQPKTMLTASSTLPSPSRPPTSPKIKSTNSTRIPSPLHPSFPIVRPKPLKPQDSHRLSLDASPRSVTSPPDKSVPANRGRPGAPNNLLSSFESAACGRARRQSCSPTRGRPPNGLIRSSGSSVPVSAMSRLHAKANTNVSPVVVGTKMVERAINTRKLAPPKQDNRNSPDSFKSSPDSSGFGRTLSKKSLDMAMRHMDIRQSVANNTRPMMTKIPSASVNTARSGSRSNKLATSGNTSSEVSAVKNSLLIDGHVAKDDIISVKGAESPASVNGE